MTRFVVVATLKRGVLETPEVLCDADQTAAIEQMRADEGKLGSEAGEVVLWQKGMPYVEFVHRRPPRSARIPLVSEEVRSQVMGRAPILRGEKYERDRAREKARVAG